MLNRSLNKGDIVKLPQGVILYRTTSDDVNDGEMSLVFAEEALKPSVAIFIEDFNERVSKLIFQDGLLLCLFLLLCHLALNTFVFYGS